MLGPLEHIHKKKITIIVSFSKNLNHHNTDNPLLQKNGKMKTEITLGAVGFAILLFL